MRDETKIVLLEQDNAALRAKLEAVEHGHDEACLEVDSELILARQQLAAALARVKELEAVIQAVNRDNLSDAVMQSIIERNTLTTRLTQAEHDAKGARECNQRQAEEITELRRDRTQVEEACRNYAEWFDSDSAKSIWHYLTLHGWKDLGPVVTHEVNKQALHPSREEQGT